MRSALYALKVEPGKFLIKTKKSKSEFPVRGYNSFGGRLAKPAGQRIEVTCVIRVIFTNSEWAIVEPMVAPQGAVGGDAR